MLYRAEMMLCALFRAVDPGRTRQPKKFYKALKNKVARAAESVHVAHCYAMTVYMYNTTKRVSVTRICCSYHHAYLHTHCTCMYLGGCYLLLMMFLLHRQCRGSSVYLLEVSLDCSLACAALHLEVRDGSTVLPDMCVQELECSSVAVLFATSSSVFRLLLPHPEAISKVYTFTRAMCSFACAFF